MRGALCRVEVPGAGVAAHAHGGAFGRFGAVHGALVRGRQGVEVRKVARVDRVLAQRAAVVGGGRVGKRRVHGRLVPHVADVRRVLDAWAQQVVGRARQVRRRGGGVEGLVERARRHRGRRVGCCHVVCRRGRGDCDRAGLDMRYMVSMAAWLHG